MQNKAEKYLSLIIVMYENLLKHIERVNQWRKQKISKNNFLILAAAAVGLLGGLAASVLKGLTHFIANFLQNQLHW